jgi:hypothetical protein
MSKCQRLLLMMAFVSLAFFVDLRANEQADSTWTSNFSEDRSELSSTGRNAYFILEPGYRLVLEETKTIDSVETRVVEERETKDGEPVEVSRNFFAISKRTGNVYYFGEEVDMYKRGKVVSHEGAWAAGIGGAKFGLMMPGQARLKARYYQEVARGLAMDRAEIVSLSEALKVPAGVFRNCLKVEETTPLEPGVKEYKYYAPGLGLIQDGSLKLVRYGKAR